MNKTRQHACGIVLFACIMASSSAAEFFSQPKALLKPDVAFTMLSSFSDPKTLRVEYNIANNYYLYRTKFHFNTDTPGYRLGEPRFPQGEVIEDEYFGEIETYRYQVIIDIPIETVDDSKQLILQATSQGCADAGVCYQPYTHTQTLTTFTE